MGLLDISISDKDRPRVDQLISILERLVQVLEKNQLVARVSLEEK